MAAAWMLTQFQLVAMLNSWEANHSGAILTARLFQNDYVPVDDTVIDDLVECDFTGYGLQNFDLDAFGSAGWTPYVAQLLLDHFLTFTASSGLAEPQTAYGYYVTDEDSELLWVERWDTPFLFEASSVLNMKPALRQKTCRE